MANSPKEINEIINRINNPPPESSAQGLPTIKLDSTGRAQRCELCRLLLDSENHNADWGIDPIAVRKITDFIRTNLGDADRAALPDLSGLDNGRGGPDRAEAYILCKKCYRILSDLYFGFGIAIDDSIKTKQS